jgi:hypothetical protein
MEQDKIMDIWEKLGALANYYKYHLDLNDNLCQIERVDNPGWAICFDLTNTILDNISFEPVISGINSKDQVLDHGNWYYCCIKEHLFYGVCAPDKLPVILNLFMDWAEKNGFCFSQYVNFQEKNSAETYWLGTWRFVHGTCSD